MDKIIAFIPARGGSKSIPFKNIKNMAGKPLILWVIEAALGCQKIDHVYISTDNLQIKSTVEKIGNKKLTVIDRSPETATDTATTELAMIEFALHHHFQFIILIQPTSPMLTALDLKEAIEAFFSAKADSMLSCVRQKRFLWASAGKFVKALNYNPSLRPRRQDFDGFLVENGAFYITTKELLLKTKCRLSGDIAVYQMAEETFVEVDTPSDWIIVEDLLKNRRVVPKKGDMKKKLGKIQLLAMDVDGVLTDSGMYYSEKGEELKKFSTRDGKGIEFLRKFLNIKIAIITGENSKIVHSRAQKLKIDHLYLGIDNKLEVIEKLSKLINIPMDNIGYIGDDVNDLPILKTVGFSACPADATAVNKLVVDYICQKEGGKGAVREICDLILEAREVHSIDDDY